MYLLFTMYSLLTSSIRVIEVDMIGKLRNNEEARDETDRPAVVVTCSILYLEIIKKIFYICPWSLVCYYQVYHY